MSIDGDVLAIGHPRAQALGVDEAGTVEIWRHHVTWTREATIYSMSPLLGAHFGAAVAVSGNQIAIGAPDAKFQGHANAGNYQVNLFNATNHQWEVGSIARSNEDDAHLGEAMSWQGKLRAVGVPGSTVIAGGYVEIKYFESVFSDTDFTRIDDPDAKLNDNFGSSVAVYRTDNPAFPDLVVIGAPFSNQTKGLVYVYANANHSGNAWTRVAILSSVNAAANEFFGSSVAVGRNRVVVGTPNRTKPGTTPVTAAGSVTVFVPDGSGGWVLQNEAFLAQPGINDELGFSVAYEPVSDRVFAGAPNRVINLFGGSGVAGAVEVFQFVKITGPFFAWKNTAEITTEEQPSTSQAAGSAIAVAQGVVFSGSPGYDVGGAPNSGRVVMFTGDAIFANAFELP